jgi:hypothetical protein
VGEAAANSNCGTVTLIEKSSMEVLPHTGLITNAKIQQGYLERFSAGLKSNVNYQVYVSDMHGNGVGHYEISKTTLDGRKISLQLDFMISLFEKGATVMNQRILFLQTESGCEITKVVSSYP